MLAALREGMERHDIHNVEVREARFPLPPDDAEPLSADVALIAHVGYDVAPIGPFLDAMEAAARRRCVAVLMERAPASYAAPFWPLIHGVERVALPACPDLVELLRARGARPRVRRLSQPSRRWPDEETLLAQLRHQLWIPADGEAHGRLVAAVREMAISDADGLGLPLPPAWIGVVDWPPQAGAGAP